MSDDGPKRGGWVDGPVRAVRSGYRLRGNQGLLSDNDEG